MYLFTTTLLLAITVTSHASYYKKCCRFGEYIEETNDSYKCTEDGLKRLEILTNETNFLKENSTGECAEVSTDFFIFTVNDGKITDKRSVSENPFPKCCPLNYSYNSVFHSCEEGGYVPEDIKENFVKVGLPKCKIIVDYELNGTVDFDYSLINATRKNLSRNALQHPDSYCIDKNEKGSFVIRECKDSLEVCEDIKCVKKCCPDGQSFINGANCYDTYTHGLNLSSLSVIDDPEGPYATIHNRTCPKIYMMKEEQYIFSLNGRGVFKYWQNTSNSFVYDDIYNTRSYCIEHTKKKDIEGYFFFMCFPEKHINMKFQYTLWPKVLSCICLTLTIMIYLLLNETRKVFGKVLVNYCVALLLENVVLTYAQVNLYPTKTDCKLRSFSIIFFATAAFSWSNVMCCDIWWTFGSAKRTLGAQQRKRDLKKLVSYFLYGWGVPSCLTLIIYLFYSYGRLPHAIQPYMTVTKCFFERRKGNYSHALFFNFPHLIIQLVNMILFIKTIIYCLKVKNEINKINDTSRDDKRKKFQKDKERLFLIIKLSVIMGVSFIFEVVSAFFDMSQMGEVPKYIEIVWDIVNCLQGVFIFVIFICKKKIYRNFLVKFKILDPRDTSTSSVHTQSTTTSNGTSMKVFSPANENGKLA